VISKVAVSVAALAAAVSPIGAQTLASRVDAVRDGIVIVSYAGRPEICGDGSSMIQFGNQTYSFGDRFGHGTGITPRCEAGPVQVSIGRAGGETVSIRTRVGGRLTPSAGETSLAVPAREGAAYFFARSHELIGRRNTEQALIAAVVADSVSVTAPLVGVIRDANARLDLRQFAAMLLGDVDEPDSRPALRAVISDADLPRDLRGSAIIGFQRDMALADAGFLERLYPSLESTLRDNVLLALSRSDDPRVYHWLTAKALDANESIAMRKQALFWAGQGAMPSYDLVALYERLDSPELREHFTFVLSQRRDERAVDKLIDVVNHERDVTVRKQALFWLGQSKDPKAQAYLRDLILRGDR
jgi:hypothetical protein